MAKRTDPRRWRWTKPIRKEILEVAEELTEKKKGASGEKLKAIELKLDLLEDCFIKLGNVKFP